MPDRDTECEPDPERHDGRDPHARPSAETLRERLLATFELMDFGVEMMAANLRRRHPGASPEEIERMLDDWLLERPGAELGDADGVPVPLERFR